MSAVILIVYDVKENCESLEKDLGKEGYQVHNAGSGQETLGMLEEKNVELIILELKLPDLSGVEVMTQVDLSYLQTQLDRRAIV